MTKIEAKAIDRINAKGLLLVYPIKNQREPASLWSEFYPRSPMDWSWDFDADGRVSRMWSLMKTLSDSGEVVYSKWYRGRATFFSKELFKSLLAVTEPWVQERWPSAASEIFDVLSSDSPLSTKIIKKEAGLAGKDYASEFDRNMRFLYQRFLIVTFGEVDDGAFPSSAVGTTELLFESLWEEAKRLDRKQAWKIVNTYLPAKSVTRKFFDKIFPDLDVNTSKHRHPVGEL